MIAGSGALMAWRGARLSGDHKRWHSVAWGVAAVVTFLFALIGGAIGNHDALQSVKDATSRADTSDGKLRDIQTALKDLESQNSSLVVAIGRIAGKAEVDPNQSAQILADQVVKKLSDFQTQLDQTKLNVKLLQDPPQNPDFLYQGNNVVAKFWNGIFFDKQKKFTFLEISNVESINFSIPVSFRGLELRCDQHGLDAGSEMSSHGMINNVMHNVTCDIISGTIGGPVVPPVAYPPYLTPPAPPAGK